MNKPPINMHNPDEHDWLDKIMAGDDEYINDDGFTGHVMNRLPSPRRSKRLNALILGCAVLLSIVSLLLSVPGLASLYETCLAFLLAQPVHVLGAFVLVICAITSGLTYWVINPDQ